MKRKTSQRAADTTIVLGNQQHIHVTAEGEEVHVRSGGHVVVLDPDVVPAVCKWLNEAAALARQRRFVMRITAPACF